MSRKIFFGDSFTSGENNHFVSFVDKLNLGNVAHKYGVSGTTIGNYSIYPVGANNLVDMIHKHFDEITTADTIYLEYGINDITAVECENVTFQQVCIALRSAIDHLRQINPKVKIVFLALGEGAADQQSKFQINYIINEYLPFHDNFTQLFAVNWFFDYKRLVKFAEKYADKVLYMITDKLDPVLVDADKIHPNNKGYELIAKNLKGFM